jgi:hypothetical protein
MKFSSGKPVKNAKMVSEPMSAPLASGQPTPPGGAHPRTTAPQPPKTEGRPVSIPKVAAAPSPRSHISDAVRSDLDKLEPSLAAGIRRVAGTK